MLERIVIKIDPDYEREADKNNAERHATVRNSSPNPARHTRKIFVAADITDSTNRVAKLYAINPDNEHDAGQNAADLNAIRLRL
jgi:hypothetical protein